MKQIVLSVTVHLNIRLLLVLLQPEPADAPTGPEPEAHAAPLQIKDFFEGVRGLIEIYPLVPKTAPLKAYRPLK